jgi:tRNA/rRNA methyltransferase
MKTAIILVRPRNPQNIGAAARAMGNFGLSDLRVVDPYPPVWRDAVSAAGAHKILKKAKVFKTLKEALSDQKFILATTAIKERIIKRPILYLSQINIFLEENEKDKIAIIFGPEKTGLTTDDILCANAILNIPTDAKVPSINLAQAVILCCYELSKNKIPKIKAPSVKTPTFKEKEIVARNIEALLDRLDFPPTLNKRKRQKRISDITASESLSKESLFFINTVAARILCLLKKI